MVGIAAAILSIGSLVNFHQYKIWGKPLLQEFVGIKRDNKDQKSIQVGNSSLNHVPTFTEGFLHSDHFSIADKELFPYSVIILPEKSDLYAHHPDISFPGLRAPPLS
mgnify:CR=1 FL=1